MPEPLLRICLELPAAAAADGLAELLSAAMEAELGVLLEDLELPVRAVGEVRAQTSRSDGRASREPFRLLADGDFFAAFEPGEDPVAATLATLHGQAHQLPSPRMIQHLWGGWGGSGFAPPGFAAAVRGLVAHRVRPVRIKHAVPSWNEADTLAVFEDALDAASRRIEVMVHRDRLADVQPAFTDSTENKVALMTDGLFYELGLTVGECRCCIDDAVSADVLRIRVNDVRSRPIGLIGRGEVLVNDLVHRLALLGIEGTPGINPANGNACAVIPAEHTKTVTDAGLTTWDAAGCAILAISAEIRASAASILTSDTVRYQLGKLADGFPYLAEYVEAELGVPRFTRVLRNLLEEGISVRNTRQLIDALALIAPAPTAPIDRARHIIFQSSTTGILPELPLPRSVGDPIARGISEGLRANLKRQISHHYTRGQSTLIVYLLEPEIEKRLRMPRRLSPVERRHLLDAVEAEAGNGQNPVVLTITECRRRLRDEIDGRFPNLAVLSYEELSPDMNIQPIARIGNEPLGDPRAIEEVERKLLELDHEGAQADLADGVGEIGPPAWVEARLSELLFFWNAAGDIPRVAETLDLWRRLAPAGDGFGGPPAEDRGAVDAWLRARDPLRHRVLRGLYLPAVEDLVLVEGGQFRTGRSGDGDPSRPALPIEVSEFRIGRLPVTGRQYAIFRHATGRSGPHSGSKGDDAVRGVRWADAVDYCNWLSHQSGLSEAYCLQADGTVSAEPAGGGFRLPTEAEWEYAARGGRRSRSSLYAGSDRLGDVGDALCRETAGVRLPNELGIHDMSGGPAEWCWDLCGGGDLAPSVAAAAGLRRVTRGGDVSGKGDAAACTVHTRGGAGDEVGFVGFRLVLGG